MKTDMFQFTLLFYGVVDLRSYFVMLHRNHKVIIFLSQ